MTSLTFLQSLGRYSDAGERHGFIDKGLDDAIQLFQRNRGLKSDGLLKPNGETEKSISQDLKQLAAGKPPRTSNIQGAKGRPTTNQRAESRDKTEPKLPELTKPEERQQSILSNTPARFKFAPDPNADGSDTIGTIDFLGKRAVKTHNSTIEKIAKKHDVDPDLIRAIMYAENSRGPKFGLNILGDLSGKSGSVMPMNINPKIWGPLIENARGLTDSRKNIEAATILIKRISGRLENPTPAAVGSVWIYSGRETTHDFGAYIGRIFNEKPWK